MKVAISFVLCLMIFAPHSFSEELWRYYSLTPKDKAGSHDSYIADDVFIEKGSAVVVMENYKVLLKWKTALYPDYPEFVANGSYTTVKSNGGVAYRFNNLSYINSEGVSVDLWGEYRSINAGLDCNLERIIISDKFFIEKFIIISRQTGNCKDAG